MNRRNGYGWKQVIVMVAFLFSGQNAVAALVNGGFESGDLTGWTSSGNVWVISGWHGCCVPSEGFSFASFNAGDRPPNGVISQAFATTLGTTYLLDFDFAKSATGTGVASLAVSVTGLGTLLNTVVSDSVGANPGQYSSYSYSFVADSAMTTLTFADNSNGTIWYDASLDEVSVTVSPVPLPAAVWLFTSGVLALFARSFLGRRSAAG